MADVKVTSGGGAPPTSCCGVEPEPVRRFESPLQAFQQGPRERLAYVTVTSATHERPDYLATIDVDDESPTFSKACFVLFYSAVIAADAPVPPVLQCPAHRRA